MLAGESPPVLTKAQIAGVQARYKMNVLREEMALPAKVNPPAPTINYDEYKRLVHQWQEKK